MANKRVLDLAKDLGVTAEDVQRAASTCGVAASGPTSSLDSSDVTKVTAALKSLNAKSGSKTLTLGKTLSLGGGRAPNDSSRHSVEVSRRRRRGRIVSPSVSVKAESPAQKAQAVASKNVERKSVPAAEASRVIEKKQSISDGLAKTNLSPAQRAAEKVAAGKVKKSEEQAKQRQQRRATQVQHTMKQPRRQSANQKNESLPTRSSNSTRESRQARTKQGGPRTTIRTGLTPAQIAASKAPRSSIKQIEEKITKERKQQRQSRPQGQRPSSRPANHSTPSAGVRRPPSVAVAPVDSVVAPAGQKRKGSQGQGFKKRRLSPAEKAARRDYSSKRHESLTPEQEERMARLAKGGGRRSKRTTITKDDEAFVVREVEVLDGMIVSDLAAKMAVKSADLIKKLFEMGQMISVNENIDADTAILIVEEFGHKPKLINEAAVEDVLIAETEEDEDVLSPRPPVVVVMGHVDHGKTSILDALRKAAVADGEAGGITQHIGAYMVKLESNERVVFVDTPGHEAFTGLRARGANLTDVAVLVVAADDGVMPQTIEALNHARSAGVPIIVAVNKMDKEGADPEMVKRQLAEHEVVPEDWGGDTIFVNVSAHTGEGLEDLLEMLALQTEILELRANPDRTGRGVVIESRLDKGRGPVATVLVQNGTFHKGDTVVVGSVMGRIRAIIDENAVQHKTAGPSIPFELIGLKEVPEAGLEIVAVENERDAKDIISYRKEKERQQGVTSDKRATLDELFADMQSGIAEVPVLIKGDVTGSVEAMAESLVKAGTDDVKVKVIHKAIGGITESDIMLASASNAIVIGFNVRPEAKAKKLAVQEGVDVRFYKVIYDAIDEVKLAMAGKLSPDEVEKVTGSAEVREVFMAPKVGAIAGCYITDGFVTRGSKVRVLREGVLIYDGTLASLRRFKDDVKEVKSGYECGIGVENFNDVKEGDTFEFYVIEEVAAKL